MTDLTDDNFDDNVDAEIAACLDLKNPKSFFTFAGAGSGKTRSLELALKTIKARYGMHLRMHGKLIAVITYTKAAANEIAKRVEFDPVIRVSTIHNFVWDLIKGFESDIRIELQKLLEKDIIKLNEEQSRSKDLGNKTSLKRAKQIDLKERKILELAHIKKFVYSPDAGKPSRGSLGHSDVINIASVLIAKNEVMQEILINRHPILLIDESQDTNADLMEALMRLQSLHPKRIILGLFGDMMQRIYNDGKPDLGDNLPENWATPTKKMNHRCPSRIVDLLNAVRRTTDQQEQKSRSDKEVGIVRLFLLPGDYKDKAYAEEKVAREMAEITGDPMWTEDGASVKRLILEHHMASSRMGFTEMFWPLYEVDELKTGALQGTLPGITFFTNLIQPLVDGRKEGNELLVANVVRNHSPLLSRRQLLQAGEKRMANLDQANAAVDALLSLWNDDYNPSFGDIIKVVAETKLFLIPECFEIFAAQDGEEEIDEDDVEGTDEEEGDESQTLVLEQAWNKFLAADYRQLNAYSLYVSGRGGFGTHQGVKGLEFPRVMVIMDDQGSRGNAFSYERLFGAKPATASEAKAMKEGKETGLDKTKKLFYVTCSRAESSLALVAYTANAGLVKNEALRSGWFNSEEIVIPSLSDFK